MSAERRMVKILMGYTNATLVFQTFALMSRFCNCGGIPNCETESTLLCACAHSHRCAVGAFQPRAMGISTSLLIPQYAIWPHLKSKVLRGSPVLNTLYLHPLALSCAPMLHACFTHASPHTCLGNILEQWIAGFNIILDFYAFRKPYSLLKECRGLELIDIHLH